MAQLLHWIIFTWINFYSHRSQYWERLFLVWKCKNQLKNIKIGSKVGHFQKLSHFQIEPSQDFTSWKSEPFRGKDTWSIFRRESKGFWLVRILSLLGIFELKKMRLLGFLTCDWYFEKKIKKTEWFEFWAISGSYYAMWSWFIRWLFVLSQGTPRMSL